MRTITALLCGVLLLGGAAASGPSGGYGARFAGAGWSGYVATGGTFTQVSADWTNPPVTCDSANELYAPWVGIDGSGNQSVEQTGVEASCANGAPEYRAWYEMYPQPPVYYAEQVGAGDLFTASVNTDGHGNYVLMIADDTRGWAETTVASASAPNASAEAVLESPTSDYPNYGEVDFSEFTINGQLASAARPSASDASGTGGQVNHTGPLDIGSFSVTYQRG